MKCFVATILVTLAFVASAPAQSLWDRRDPRTAYLFVDTRARNKGDLLTIVVNETTEFEGMEKKEMNKETTTAAALKLKAQYDAGKLTSREFSGAMDALVNSQRKFDGKANNTIDRRLLDRMTVTVVGVLPNGNIVIEGRRSSVITHEQRTLVVSGVVRPLDIGPFNTVQSQFIANFNVYYEGCGPESSFTNQGWLGRIVNKIWPF